jgi:hypothetical protein
MQTLSLNIHSNPVRVPEEIYLREGVRIIDGMPVMVFRAHPDSPCETCEFPLGSNLKHPVVDGEIDVRLVCGGIHVRMTR